MSLLHLPAPIMLDGSALRTLILICVVGSIVLVLAAYAARSPRRDDSWFWSSTPSWLFYVRPELVRQDPEYQLLSSLCVAAAMLGVGFALGIRYILAHPTLLPPSAGATLLAAAFIVRLVLHTRQARRLGPAIAAIDVQEVIVARDISSAGTAVPVNRVRAGESFGLEVRLALKPSDARKVRFQYGFTLEDAEGVRLGATRVRRATLDPKGASSLAIASQWRADAETMPVGTYVLELMIDERKAASRSVELVA